MNFGTWIGLVVFFISLYILWQIKQLLLLLFTAIVLATSLNILVKTFQRRGIKRVNAVFLSMLLLILVTISCVWIVIPPFIDQFQDLAKLVPQGIEKLNIWIDLLSERLDPRIITLLPDTEELNQQLQPLIKQFLGSGLTVFYNSLGVLLGILLLLAITLMLLADPVTYRQGFKRLFPAFYRRRVEEILDLCAKGLEGWLVGILFNMVVIALLSFMVLLLLGIPLALSQAMLAGVMTFIPNLGPTLSVISPMAIALIEAPWKSLTVLVLYIIIQQIESNVLTPIVMAQQVALLPAVTLLSQIFFATFFGFLGLFLSLPLTVVAQIWFKEVIIKDVLDQWNSSLIGKPHLEKKVVIKEAARLEEE
ncbi:AI-2E family transporter [Pleurocapsa sp. CCALA 161]|uniref:AI-2E family transporter n=1 Tax=Pleurocapsa sp. CCALA 161 TaxID=2107688 RepID=UPI000D04CDE8|nr:AI-2E family transporter [Pleurocapsa sp. CCALA 161]PSB11877.1 AI-2E family transporter [Pleurocapsa sp. CCALA 161]